MTGLLGKKLMQTLSNHASPIMIMGDHTMLVLKGYDGVREPTYYNSYNPRHLRMMYHC